MEKDLLKRSLEMVMGRMQGLQVNDKEKSFMVKLKSYPITGLNRFLGLQDFKASRISRQSAHKGGKVVILLYP